MCCQVYKEGTQKRLKLMRSGLICIVFSSFLFCFFLKLNFIYIYIYISIQCAVSRCAPSSAFQSGLIWAISGMTLARGTLFLCGPDLRKNSKIIASLSPNPYFLMWAKFAPSKPDWQGPINTHTYTTSAWQVGSHVSTTRSMPRQHHKVYDATLGTRAILSRKLNNN